MTDEEKKDDRWRDERWTMVKRDMANRHDIFPEDDILDIITISRYNYHK